LRFLRTREVGSTYIGIGDCRRLRCLRGHRSEALGSQPASSKSYAFYLCPSFSCVGSPQSVASGRAASLRHHSAQVSWSRVRDGVRRDNWSDGRLRCSWLGILSCAPSISQYVTCQIKILEICDLHYRICLHISRQMKATAISLFSGCGGSDLALQQAGFKIRWSNDIWDVACDTYRDNIKSPVIKTGDITTFKNFPRAKLLVGCYPCQGYSQAGKRNWNASINFLYREFDRVLRKVRPKAFVVENVNGMAYGESRTLLENQLCRYRMAGYKVKWSVLNAKNFGVAQNRRRVFLVGIRSDLDFEYNFPKPTHGPGLTPFVTQREVLNGLPSWPIGEFNKERLHWYYLSRRRRMPWGSQSPCIVGHWRHVPLHPSSPPLIRLDTDHWKFSRKGRARRFSYRECARLQGFPRSFKWKRGTTRERFQMIGNAVPPPLFLAVLKSLNGLW
jgi:DNA (cytosine-5)-methyltransferase 1